MIQDYLAKVLEENLEPKKKTVDINSPTFSVDYFYADDNSVTVYSNAGPAPDLYDTNYQFPYYQVWIRSSDRDKAKSWAERAYNLLHKRDMEKENPISVVDDYTGEVNSYYIFLIAAASNPIRIGDNDGVMEYSLNLEVTMTKIKQDETMKD